MRISPIALNLNTKNKSQNPARRMSYVKNFEGKINTKHFSPKKLELFNTLKQKFEGLFARTKANVLSAEDVAKIVSMPSFEASLAFYNLYEIAPKFSKVLLDSDAINRMENYDVEYFMDLHEEGLLTEKRADAFRCMLDAKYSDGNFLTNPTGIYDIILGSAKEEDLDLIVKHSDKIKGVFSNINLICAAPYRYIESARIFENTDVDVEELVKGFYMFRYDVEHTVQWAFLPKDVRSKILEFFLSSDFLTSIYELSNGEEIIINDNLLAKMELLEENKNEIIELYPEDDPPPFFFDNDFSKENIINSIKLLKNLSPKAKEFVMKHDLSDNILEFDYFKNLGKIFNNITSNDVGIFLEILAEKDFDNCLSFDGDFAIIPTMDEIAQKIFKNNFEEMFDLRPPRCDVNSESFLKNLFNPNFKTKLTQLNEVLYTSKAGIKKELALRCANKNPEFVNRVFDVLHHPTFDIGLVDIPNIEKRENLVQVLFAISKLQLKMLNQAVENKLELFTNSKRVQNYYKALLTDTEEARVQKMRVQFGDEHFLMSDLHNAYNEVFAPHLLRNLINLVSITDAEFANMYLDRGTQSLRDKADKLYSLNNDTKCFLQDIFKQAKCLDDKGNIIKLSGKQKITIATLVTQFYSMFKEQIETALNVSKTTICNKSDYILNYDNFVNTVYSSLISSLGDFTEEQKIFVGKNCDLNYLYLLLSPKLQKDENLKLCYEQIFRGTFNEYINNPATLHGKANLETAKAFQQSGLDYKTWISGIGAKEFVLNGQIYTIDLMDKSSPNSLFMGYYTNCCTALEASNGFSVPKYLLHSAFNIVAIKDAHGSIVATSRLFIVKQSDNTPALVLDNIEISNDLRRKVSVDDDKKFVQNVWDYMVEYADGISETPIDVFMSSMYKKLDPPECSKVKRNIKILGDFVDNAFYINSKGSVTDITMNHYLEFLLIR